MIQSSKQPIRRTAWYCVRTQSKREAVAAGQLELLGGVEVFAPRIRFRRNTKRGKVWFEEALFPGYIFARFDFQTLFRRVSSTVGVRGLVRFRGDCAIVPDWMIETLRDERFDEGPVTIELPMVKVGDETVLSEGALCGLHAVITQVCSGGERVKVLMEMMGTMIEAEVSTEDLEPVA